MYIKNKQKKRKHPCLKTVHLEQSGVHPDVQMLFGPAAVFQVVERFDLVQRVQQPSGEQVDPQHAGRVHTQLQTVHLGVQVGRGHWRGM